MLKLTSNSQEPSWLDLLPGVRVQVRPVSVTAMLLARAAAGEALKNGGERDDATIKAGEAFTRSLARSGIVAWEGIGDAEGVPVEPSPERIEQLLEHWPAFDAIDRFYVAPALTQDAEKKRLIALARWHFEGGEAYCAACPARCEGCPYDEHAAQTPEGILAWAVIQRSAGQVRAVMGGVYALDFGAILLLADAMGALSPLLVDALPEIEPIVVAAYRRDADPS